MITLHIATGEFCFAEVPFEGTSDEAIVEAKRLQLVAQKPGIPQKDFYQFIDNMIEKKPNQVDPGILEEMDSRQQAIFDCVRKSLGRIAYKKR